MCGPESNDDYKPVAVIVLIILLSRNIGPWVFLLAAKEAKIFERKYKSNWKFQASEPMTNTGSPNCKENRFLFCLQIDW